MGKKLRGSIVLALGFMLSPLSWWNDVFFNLPIAYGFGYLCGLWQPQWLLGGTVVGYWLSNVIGLLMIQWGAQEMMEKGEKPYTFKRDLLMGLASSTVYTLAIVGLVQFRVVDIGAIFPLP